MIHAFAIVLPALAAGAGGPGTSGVPAAAGPGPSRAPAAAADADALLARLGGEPDVRALVRAAEVEADLRPERVRSWMRRARRAGWLPRLAVRLDHDLARDESLDPEAGVPEVDVDRNVRWAWQATWDLDRWIFDPAELAVARQGLFQDEQRQALGREVVRLYFERLRLRAQAAIDPAPDAAAAVERRLRVREIEALIDSLTGGALTRGLSRTSDRARDHAAPGTRSPPPAAESPLE